MYNNQALNNQQVRVEIYDKLESKLMSLNIDQNIIGELNNVIIFLLSEARKIFPRIHKQKKDSPMGQNPEWLKKGTK